MGTVVIAARPPTALTGRARATIRIASAAHAGAVAWLALLWGALYTRHAASLGLYSDDWGHLQQVGTPLRTIITTWPFDFRPMDEAPWLLFHAMFGGALMWYYLALFAAGLATACLLHALLLRASGSVPLALASATLWTVYPADESQFWLSALHYRLGMLFLLLGLALLVLPKAPRPWHHAAAMACCVLCLASSELFLGALLVLPAAAAWRAPDGGRLTRAVPALPYLLLIAVYVAYRVWLGPHILHLPDDKTGQYSANPQIARTVLVGGLAVVLLQGWQVAASALQHILEGDPATPHDAWAILTWAKVTDTGPLMTGMLVLYLLALVLTAYGWLRRERDAARWRALRPGAVCIVVGLIGVMLGFAALLPTTNGPTLDGINSRTNIAALPGAATLTAGAAWVLSRWLPAPARLARPAFVAAMAALALLGCAQVELVAAIYVAGWSAQQPWQALHQAMPYPPAHSRALVFTADQANADTLTALQPWGRDGALAVQYPGRHITGDYVTGEAAIQAYKISCQASSRCGHMRVGKGVSAEVESKYAIVERIRAALPLMLLHVSQPY